MSKTNCGFIRPRSAIALAFLCLAIAPVAAHSATITQTLYIVGGQGVGYIDTYGSAGLQTAFPNGVGYPGGAAFDASGNLLVSQYVGGGIYKYSPQGNVSTFAANTGGPIGLAFDRNGNLFEGAHDTGNINMFTPGGVESTFATGLSHPDGLAFDRNDNLFVTDYGSGAIYEFAPNGTRTTFAAGLQPVALAFDAAGNLFEANYHAGQMFIEKFTSGGVGTLFTANVSGPNSLAFDTNGNLIVADYLSGNIYEFSPAGARTTLASGLSFPGIVLFLRPFPNLQLGYWRRSA